VLGIADGRLKIWNLIDTDVMVNQFIIYKNSLKLPSRRHFSLWIDSGGYQIMKHNVRVDMEDVIRRYALIDAEYYMSLDIPVTDPRQANQKVIEKNYKNFLELIKHLPDKNIIPIIHLYPSKYLLKFSQEYIDLGCSIIAYGGIVPPLLRKTKLRFKALLGLLILLKSFPNVRFHVLGAGSYLMIRIFESLGVHSLDTSSWRVKAAFGHVLIPGLGERYVGNRNIRFNTPRIKRMELEVLYNSLKNTNFPLMENFYSLLKTFEGRAIINAWVIAKINQGISRKSSFFKLYKKLLKLKEESTEELAKIYEGL